MKKSQIVQIISTTEPFSGRRLHCIEDRLPVAKGTVLVMGGLLADQLASGPSRAQVIADTCRANGWSSIRFNYTGHGDTEATRSDGSLSDLSLSAMLAAACDVLQYFAPARIAIVGSSLGAGLIPFVVRQVKQYEIMSLGAFGISAVPPAALAGFIYQQINGEAKRCFDAGEPVKVNSPTLPVPFILHKRQIDDLEKFDYTGMYCSLGESKVRLLVGSLDHLSTIAFNEMLGISLGGSRKSVTVLQSEGHEISYATMAKELESWMNDL